MVTATASRDGIRVLAVDLDGTLVTSAYEMSDRSVAALTAFRATGRELVVATGRSRRSALPWARRMGGVSAMVCQNGAMVYDFAGSPGGRLISETRLPEDAVRRVVALSRELDLHFHGFGGDDWFYERRRPGTALYERRSGFGGTLVDFDEMRHPAFNKLMFVGEQGEAVEAAAVAAAEACAGEASVFFSSPGFLEIVPRGVDKAAGLAVWLGTRGLTLAEVMAIGDADNDREMILAAGYGIAMAGAPAELRARAAAVAGGVDEDGAAAAIESFLAAFS